MSTQTRPVIVACTDDAESVAQVATRLRLIGFEVDQMLEIAGTVVGRWDGPLDELSALPGVEAAEESATVHPQGEPGKGR